MQHRIVILFKICVSGVSNTANGYREITVSFIYSGKLFKNEALLFYIVTVPAYKWPETEFVPGLEKSNQSQWILIGYTNEQSTGHEVEKR